MAAHHRQAVCYPLDLLLPHLELGRINPLDQPRVIVLHIADPPPSWRSSQPEPCDLAGFE
jgi:hypothetical protein